MRKTSPHLLASALLLAVGLGLGACQSMNNNDMAMAKPAAPTLYQRLGGKAAISVVVDDFVANVAADPVINKRFAHTDIPKLKMNLVDQLCQASGGPCVYHGKDMVTAHKGMHITVTEFNAMGGDMAKALDQAKVPDREKHEVLALLGSMEKDVVGH